MEQNDTKFILNNLPENKGWFKVVVALLQSPKTRTEVQEYTGLSRMTAKRRLDEMTEMGWVYPTARLESGEASKKYCLDGKTFAVLNQIEGVEVNTVEE